MKKVVIGLVVLLAIAGGAFAVVHRSKTTSSSTSSNTTSSKVTEIIQKRTDPTVGQYLADSNGNALYTYGPDTSGVSNCTASCLYTWPVYAPSGSSTSLPSNVTIIKRTDGASQYAYKGMPLYTFTSDSSGKVTGDGVSNFRIAKP